MTALFTKHIKRQFVKRKFKPSLIKRDLKDYVCYSCKEKGHLARNFLNSSGEEKTEAKEPGFWLPGSSGEYKILVNFQPIPSTFIFGPFLQCTDKIGRASCRERVYVLV